MIPGASPKSQIGGRKTKNKAKEELKVLREGEVSKEWNTKITVEMGDITEGNSEVIVCSATPFLDFKGGLIDYIIHKGGECIKEECEDIIE